jgi:hypothetical protein
MLKKYIDLFSIKKSENSEDFLILKNNNNNNTIALIDRRVCCIGERLVPFANVGQ